MLRALLHDGTLRSGAPIEQVGETSRTLVLADPRLVRDVDENEIPDVSTATSEAWRAYWRRWPIAAWAGELSTARRDGGSALAGDAARADIPGRR